MLIIHNINDRIKYKDLKNLFAAFGGLISISLDIDTNKLMLHYSDESRERYVQRAMHNYMLAGRRLMIERDNTPEIKKTNKIEIFNFPKEDKDELESEIKKYSKAKLIVGEGIIIECANTIESEHIYDNLHGRWYNKMRIKCVYV
ncbi:hypothetical protein TCON_0040 [Astathelohania contejeani]|uniref:RRM domain-containing protein n=1 Tax=Astathelohania contejeani TaxID=164912 RepID=A0ABQ7I2R1_9MICR|nr:hypothetical protein TCON_0040 [Thelohania contejeani]